MCGHYGTTAIIRDFPFAPYLFLVSLSFALCSPPPPPPPHWLYTYTPVCREEANVPGSSLGERETSHEWLFSGARACTQRRDDGERGELEEKKEEVTTGGLMKPVEVRQTGSASSPLATLVLSSPPSPFVRSVVRSLARRRDPSERAEQRYRPVSLRLSPSSFYLSVQPTRALSLSVSTVPLWLRSPCISQTQIAASDSCTRLPAYVTLPDCCRQAPSHRDTRARTCCVKSP